MLAVACDHLVAVGGGSQRVDDLAASVPARAWQCVSAGKGAKGHRYYDWAFVRLDDPGPAHGGQAAQHWLLVRRHQRSGELAYYRCWTPRPTPLARAGPRGRMALEDRRAHPDQQGLCGLDQHQVRRYDAWYRWTTLAMLAHAVLVVAALTERTRHPDSPELIGVTCNEVQHLFAWLLTAPLADAAHRLRWSLWRRRHQARARTCHYRRQATAWRP